MAQGELQPRVDRPARGSRDRVRRVSAAGAADRNGQSALQARLDASPRVRALQAKAGPPSVQRMVLNLDPGDQKITKDAENIGRTGGGKVVGWSGATGIVDDEVLHVVGHLEAGTMDKLDPEALAAKVAAAIQGRTGVTIDLHGCFAANPRALEADAEDLWASYAGRFQKKLSALHQAQVQVIASLGAEYTSSGGVTRVRSPEETQETFSERVDQEARGLGGPVKTRNERATNAIIEGQLVPGFFLGQDVGRVAFKDGVKDVVDRADRGKWKDADEGGPWDASAYTLQAKLEVGAADDAYEREADRMARHAIARMYAPEPATRDEEASAVGGDAVQMKATPLLRHGGGEGFDAPDHVESAIGSARGGGSPLPDALRAPLESSLGADFGGVRIHSDARADALNQSIQAKAFTTGQDVFFRQGAYQPGSRSGQELLAHELTHVVQQSGPDVARRPDEGRIQRDVAWREEPKAPDTQFDAFVNQLNAIVNESYASVIASPVGIVDVDGYTKRWKDVAASFATALQETGDLAKALTEEPFVYTAFGYAVESLTLARVDMGALNAYLPRDTKVFPQVTRGHTRPDLVVKSQAGDVGWFDITASRSETHIQDKDGSGWKTRSYVAEVTYPSLSQEALLKIAEATLSAAKGSTGPTSDLAKRVKAHKERRAQQEFAAAVLVGKAITASKKGTNLAEQRRIFETDLAERLNQRSPEGEVQKLAPSVAKGFLQMLWRRLGESYAGVAAEAGYNAPNQGGARTDLTKEILYSLEV